MVPEVQELVDSFTALQKHVAEKEPRSLIQQWEWWSKWEYVNNIMHGVRSGEISQWESL